MTSPIDPKNGKANADRPKSDPAGDRAAEEAQYRANSAGAQNVDETRQIQTTPKSGSTPVDEEPKKGGWAKWLLPLLGVLLLLGLLFWFLNNRDNEDNEPAPAPAETTSATASPTPATGTPAEGAVGAVDDPQAALADAQSFIDSPAPYSYQGLYDELVAEEGGRYTPAAARYAVDNVDADWNQQAAEAAQGYATDTDMTPEQIFEELTSANGGKFTTEEAKAGVDALS